MEITDAVIKERLERVRGEISCALDRSGRSASEVRTLVASKYYSPDQVSILKDAGVTLLGENKSEDLAEKQELFGGDFEWHFIGHLQRRKAREVVPRVSLIHSVDSQRLIEELAKRLGVAEMPGFGMSEEQHIDRMLGEGGAFQRLKEDRFVDMQH